jgi:NADPH:quinone reductase-like Zn-dependent oxidoreductase
MLTEFAVLNENAVVPIPEHLSYEEAAALPCAAVTAWNALTCGVPISAGDTVLTLGSGGVSLFAIQLAKHSGARVISTTSSEEKAERLRALGADEVINYKEIPDWHRKVRELTNGRGVDRVIEVGGAGTLPSSILSTAVEGQISQVGWLASEKSTVPISALASNVFTLRRIALGSRAHFQAVNRVMDNHRIRPVIDRVFPFEETLDAFRYYKDQSQLGKVVIRLS